MLGNEIIKRMILRIVETIRTHWAFLAIIFVSNLVIYHDYWTGELIITGKDFLTAFSLLLNFQTDCLQGQSLPLWNPFMNFGYPFVEHYSNSMFFPTHLIMGLFTGSNILIIQREILLWITLGGIGMYLCVREFGHSQIAGVVAASAFMFGGQITALPQWHVLVYNASCFPFFILGYHRALRYNAAFSPLTVAFITMSIFGGHITTTVLSLYIFGLYVAVDSLFRKRILFGVRYILIAYTLSALLASPKLIPIYQAMELGPRIKSYTAESSKDPFNIINLYNFMSFLLPVKYYFSLYIGQISIIALIYGAIRKRLRFNALAILFVLTAWFLMVDGEGNVSLIRSAANFLPMMRLVRNEWLEWFYPCIFLVLYLSEHVDDFFSGRFNKALISALAIFLAILSAIFFCEFNTLLYRNAYITHIALAVLWGIITLAAGKKYVQSALVVLLLLAEFSLVFSRVNVDEPPLREAEKMRIAVIDQGSVSRSFLDDNRVLNKFYAVAVQDSFRPTISDSKKWPYLVSGFGEAPTYNAYPEQFANFIDSMNLKRFAGWWYNAQERFDFIELKDSPLIMALDQQPLFLFYDRITGASVPNVVTFESITCSSFTFSTMAGTPGFLLLHQLYDNRWNINIDGKEYKPQHANKYFMGINIPPGDHKVSFLFRDRSFTISVIISLITFTAIVAFSVMQLLRSRKEPEKLQ